MAVVDDLKFAACRHQNGLNAGFRYAEHRIEQDFEIFFLDRLDIDHRQNRIDVGIERIDAFDDSVFDSLLERYGLYVLCADFFERSLERIGDRFGCVAAPPRENLDAIVIGRVVAGGYGHADVSV